MRVVSIKIRDEGQDELITAVPFIPIREYETHYGATWGIPLGTNRIRYEETPEETRPKYLRMRVVDKDQPPITQLTHLTLHTPEDRTAFVLDEDDGDVDHIAVYLTPSEPRVGAAIMRAKDLKFQKKLFEGCHYSDKPIERRDGGLFYPYSCPSLLIANIVEEYTITYYDVQQRARMDLTFVVYIDAYDTVVLDTRDHRVHVKKVPAYDSRPKQHRRSDDDNFNDDRNYSGHARKKKSRRY